MNNYYKDIEQMIDVKKSKENRDYDSLLKAGNEAQIEKLKFNEHKKGFENINLEYAVDRLYQEVEELHDCFVFDDTNFFDIRHEAADIANFAHMIIYKCNQELSSK